jgi:preprotein translocase subunit SecF
MIDVIGKRKIYLGISSVLVLVSLILILSFGLRQGIDLRGGTEWRLEVPSVTGEELQTALIEISGLTSIGVKRIGDEPVLHLPPIDEETHQYYLDELRARFGEINEMSFSSIGPTIGAELRRRAVWAIILVLISISAYVAFVFRKTSFKIRSWKYGLTTLITLFHDVSIPTGLLAVLGWWQGIEIDINFIVALLVVMGFSVHDTIVVFDRIRENLIISRERRTPLAEIINHSVRETLARSVNTSLTLIFVLVALVLLGPPSLVYFVLTILVGTIIGTYSSIFVASPLLYVWTGDLQK